MLSPLNGFSSNPLYLAGVLKLFGGSSSNIASAGSTAPLVTVSSKTQVQNTTLASLLTLTETTASAGQKTMDSDTSPQVVESTVSDPTSPALDALQAGTSWSIGGGIEVLPYGGVEATLYANVTNEAGQSVTIAAQSRGELTDGRANFQLQVDTGKETITLNLGTDDNLEASVTVKDDTTGKIVIAGGWGGNITNLDEPVAVSLNSRGVSTLAYAD